MKKLFCLIIAFCLATALAWAQEAAREDVSGTALEGAGNVVANEMVTPKPEPEEMVVNEAIAPKSEAEEMVVNQTVAVPPLETGEAIHSEVMILKGDIIDNMCATANKEGLAEFVKTHTKECVLKPACVASGYAIFTDGKLLNFDKASSAVIEEFLKKPESKLQVEVTVKKVGDELSLIEIENQK